MQPNNIVSSFLTKQQTMISGNDVRETPDDEVGRTDAKIADPAAKAEAAAAAAAYKGEDEYNSAAIDNNPTADK